MRRSKMAIVSVCVSGMVAMSAPGAAQSGWEPVVADGAAVDNGFGDLANEGVGAAAVFDSWLYVVVGGDSGAACQLWRSANGVDWEHVLPDGFGDANNQGAAATIVSGGFLYVGTTNLNGAQIYRSDNGTDWTQVVDNGLWNADNRAITAFAEHDGQLFAGTENEADGGEIWRYNGTSWSPFVFGGLGEPSNRAVASLASFNGSLYAGTFRESALYNQPGQIRWMDDLGVWHWLPQNDGFGDPFNVAMSAMQIHDGMLYVGTSQLNPVLGNGCEVWRTDGSGLWTIAGVGGFGSPLSMAVLRLEEYLGGLYAAVAQPDPNVLPGGTGAKIMRFVDALDWETEIADGFGDADNWAIGALETFDYGLYAGTFNTADGCEIWRNDVVFIDGFDRGDTLAWSGTVP